MWTDIKLIYDTLQSQAIFVKGFYPEAPLTGTVPCPDLPAEPNSLRLGLTCYTRFYQPPNCFPILHPGLTLIDVFCKKNAAPCMFDWVNTPLKRLEFSR